MADAPRWPDLDLLCDLDVLLEERHVTRAAKRRGITQSAMSARLAKLRAFFGDALLVDARPTLLLTPRAEALRAPLRDALQQLTNTLANPTSFDPNREKRTFVIVGGDLAEALAIPRLLAGVEQVAPRITFQMRRASNDLSLELGERGGDLAFAPLFRGSGRLHSMPVLEDRFVVMMASDHPLAQKPMTLNRYLAHPHVVVAPGGLPGSIVDDALAKLGKKRRIAAVLQHFISAPFVLARSRALLTCPTSLSAAVTELLPVVTVAPPFELPSYSLRAMWHDRCHADPAHVWLRDMIRTSLAAEPPHPVVPLNGAPGARGRSRRR